MGGMGDGVGGKGVSEGGRVAVSVGVGMGVSVGGTGVAVGGSGVLVAVGIAVGVGMIIPQPLNMLINKTRLSIQARLVLLGNMISSFHDKSTFQYSINPL